MPQVRLHRHLSKVGALHYVDQIAGVCGINGCLNASKGVLHGPVCVRPSTIERVNPKLSLKEKLMLAAVFGVAVEFVPSNGACRYNAGSVLTGIPCRIRQLAELAAAPTVVHVCEEVENFVHESIAVIVDVVAQLRTTHSALAAVGRVSVQVKGLGCAENEATLPRFAGSYLGGICSVTDQPALSATGGVSGDLGLAAVVH